MVWDIDVLGSAASTICNTENTQEHFFCLNIQGSIEIIFPEEKAAKREKGESGPHWLSETYKTYFKLNSDDLPNVQYIIGFVPTTVSTAVEMKRDWRNDAKVGVYSFQVEMIDFLDHTLFTESDIQGRFGKNEASSV